MEGRKKGKMKGRKEGRKDGRKDGRMPLRKEDNIYGTKKSKEYRGGI